MTKMPADRAYPRREAVETSQIEGEILNRDSVQSSLRHQFGFGSDRPNISPPNGASR
jgi:hypothetical protein